MPYPIGPKTETGWPYTCQRCGLTFFHRYRIDIKWCPDCRPKRQSELARDSRLAIAAANAERRASNMGSGPSGGTDYCKRMHMTNPGKMCGTRDFCYGCEFAGGGNCRDSDMFGYS